MNAHPPGEIQEHEEKGYVRMILYQPFQKEENTDPRHFFKKVMR